MGTVVGTGIGTVVGAGRGTAEGAGMGTVLGAGMGRSVGTDVGKEVGALGPFPPFAKTRVINPDSSNACVGPSESGTDCDKAIMDAAGKDTAIKTINPRIL